MMETQMTKPLPRAAFASLAALSLLLGAAGVCAPASARSHGHVLTAQGAGGRTLVKSRTVERQPGAAHVERSRQGSGGHGATTVRDAQWGDGSFTGGSQTVLNNGKSFGRTTSATANGDGSATYSTTVTGPEGQSRTVTGTAKRNP
jgi:hypothetical protein